MKRKTRTRLIETTVMLLQKQGYHATSVKQIIVESGTPKGSFYYHFPDGKEDLTCAAMDEAGRAWRQRLEQAIHPAQTPAQVVAAVCRVLSEFLVVSGYTEGSPLTTVALEAASASLRLREICAQNYASWEELIGFRFQQFGMAPARARALATTLLSAIEGALVLCRVNRDTTPLQRISDTLASFLIETTGS
jgi:TetR/AcrR family transcriptional repressor of lmrAB and yxaGH operons